MAVRLLCFRGNEFQKILDPAIQNGTDPCQYIDIQSGDFVVAIVIDLGTLYFSTVAELVLTDTGLLDQLVEFDSNGSVVLHVISPLSSKMVVFFRHRAC